VNAPRPPADGLLANISFAFGGGLQDGGFSREAMDLLKPIFDFDYMGSAEFEFGAVPDGLQKILEFRADGDLVAFVVNVVVKPTASRSDESQDAVSTKIHVLCHKEHRHEITDRIVEWVHEDPRLCEHVGLRHSILALDQSRCPTGWLELDNGFFFTIDATMYERLSTLLCQLSDNED
jgi:hypothetical protein